MIAVPSLLVASVACTGGDVDFVESRILVRDDLVGYECPDVDLDSRGDVLLVVREGVDRLLQLHRQREDGGLPPEPDWRFKAPSDVIAYALCDVREEPGLEVVLFTRLGVFSISTTNRGLRGNLRRELSLPLFPDLADPNAIVRWRHVLDLDGDGVDEILVPTDGALVAFRIDAGGKLAPAGTIVCPVEGSSGNRGTFSIGRANIEIAAGVDGLFPRAQCSLPFFEQKHLLSRSVEWSLPRLLDWDGDRLQDAVWVDDLGVRVRRQTAGGEFSEPEPMRLPETLEDVEDVEIVDLDGDGRYEVIVLEEDDDGGLRRDFAATVVPRNADGSFAETPSARIKLNGAQVQFDFVDVDRDGRVDLVARTFDLPLGIDSLTSVRVDSTLLVFRGVEGPGFSRRPDARFERSLQPDDLARIRESFIFNVDGDYDGDGLNDLLLLRKDGLLQILPLVRDGDAFAFATEPRSTYQPAKPVRGARPEILSHDRVADLVLRHEDALTVFVSRRAR